MQSLKTQSLEVHNSENRRKVVVKESNSFNGIPYADYFTVHTEWIASAALPSGLDKLDCTVSVYLEVRFVKSTWLQGTIESNTKAEILQVLETWLDHASHHIRQQAAIITQPMVRDIEEQKDLSDDDDEEDQRSTNGSDLSAFVSDEEDALFYDCEDGEATALMKPRRNTSRADSVYALESSKGHRRPSGPAGSGDSARDVAVQVVETVFVLAQFSFWQVHQFYAYDLKELFNVEPDKVMGRILHSFFPGWHSPLLVHPDLYGPLLAVFLLPQTLLLCMETSKHGCNSNAQLSNAVIVCLLIWLGLATFYRLLAMVIAPSIGIKQCLSILGYGFFSWNAALLSTLPLEHFNEHSLPPGPIGNVTLISGTHGIHGDPMPVSTGGSSILPMTMFLPLVIFGLPCSMAQGYVFWEHTPASSLTLQPSALPASMQQFAANNSRCLQRLLWAFPKILAFILVAGTHYQLLWYMARVFLPGRRQLCRLSALMQPSQYADILTQKELRLFALKLLSGKLEED